MEQLMIFEDKDIFQKERPTGMTRKQEDEFYREIAQKIVDEGWGYYLGGDEVDVIVSDLRRLKVESAYKPARKLRREGVAKYEKDTAFRDYLESCSVRIQEFVRQNVKEWVKAHGVKAKYGIGELLAPKKDSKDSYANTLWGIKVVAIHEDRAEYEVRPYELMHMNFHHKRMMRFEYVEGSFERLGEREG